MFYCRVQSPGVCLRDGLFNGCVFTISINFIVSIMLMGIIRFAGNSNLWMVIQYFCHISYNSVIFVGLTVNMDLNI